jgi:ATP-dependent DNA ligase
MLNINNSPYHFDRTRDLLKVKEMSDMALKCVGFTPGNGKYTNTLGAITFAVPDPNFPDATVNVSGMDDAMRDEVWNNKQKYLGRY